ncbi:TetR/AcrR family transcriptional regulator [Nocardia iowensis]|uniref:TetR/AcrR family transcriptional regulator n=1 Tax=Nocardia iowensis TaxID=204891 RepID=A0ABX8RGX7_NOCIO|nr:TetR/AcrR family transcriptional regulator [Nocardia iowensis]QXN88863.1 TetR/AcrR family transcriptional regulator [Nocardia iowensis]
MPTERRLRRREPVQERSRQRVERILAAALELLTEGGMAAVNTRAVAARAGVSVATLYQFFTNREALLEELALRSTDRLDDEMPDRLAAVTADTIAAAVDQIVELHRIHYRAHPELVALYYARRARGEFADARDHRKRFADMVRRMLIDCGLLPDDLDPLVTELAMELGDRIIEVAYRSMPGGDSAVIAEGKLAIARYLEAHAR